MKQESQTSKRIVSRGNYAKAQGKRAALTITMFLYCGMLVFCATMAIISLIFSMFWLVTNNVSRRESAFILFSASAFLGLSSAYFFHRVKSIRNSINKIEPGVPLTRANTADLPANDSLVRASQEPVQAQEAVLLRAATGKRQEEQEQLLRATAGRQE